MSFEIVQIRPRIFYAKFEEPHHMMLSTFRIEGARFEQKNEYENYRQYIKRYMEKCKVSGYGIFSKDFRLFLRKFKKKAIPEEVTFASKIIETVKASGLSINSKFIVIVCYNKEDSIAYRHEMSHALFYTDYSYKQKVLRLFKHVKPDMKQKMFDCLLKFEYKFNGLDDPLFIDEAFCRIATENVLKKGFSDEINLPKKEIDRFKKLYQDNLKKQ